VTPHRATSPILTLPVWWTSSISWPSRISCEDTRQHVSRLARGFEAAHKCEMRRAFAQLLAQRGGCVIHGRPLPVLLGRRSGQSRGKRSQSLTFALLICRQSGCDCRDVIVIVLVSCKPYDTFASAIRADHHMRFINNTHVVLFPDARLVSRQWRCTSLRSFNMVAGKSCLR